MVHPTGNGFIVEGPLVLHPGVNEALTQIDNEFFDDLLRERFIGPEAKKQYETCDLHLERVRITVEVLEE